MITYCVNENPHHMKCEVSGLVLIENFISEEDEAELLEAINAGHWVSNRTKDRRVQIFGPYHDIKYKIIPKPHALYSPKPHALYSPKPHALYSLRGASHPRNATRSSSVARAAV